MTASPARFDPEATLVDELRQACEPLPPVDDPVFGHLADRFSDARVVLLGEATHGTADFYNARAALTARLVAEHRFRIVAVEADWPDANAIDRRIRQRAPVQDEPQAFTRFPTWMWRNTQVVAFLGWIEHFNAARAPDDRVEFRGLDIYSLRASIASVLAYLDKVDPYAAALARKRYGCLTPWQAEPAWYGRAVLHGERDPCEDEVVAQLVDLLADRLDYTENDDDDFFDAAQNARTVLSAERYYRVMYRASNDSWNLRDTHMFDTLQRLLEHRGDNSKAVIWAHNSHVGDASATAMDWQGEINIGHLCRRAYGGGAVLVGFGTDRGTVAAADDWDEPVKIKPVRPSHANSYESLFHRTGLPRAVLDLRPSNHYAANEALAPKRLERAIGVIYRPETELQSHYFEAELPAQFDAYLWFDETRAVSPLPVEKTSGVPETFPFGV
jgi:erythromycin esterase-like protein